MSVKEDSLPVPDEALKDKDAQEHLRAWIVNEQLHCSIVVGQWEPEIWGMVLGDILRYVVEDEVENRGADPKEVIQKVVASFMNDLGELKEDIDSGEIVF